MKHNLTKHTSAKWRVFTMSGKGGYTVVIDEEGRNIASVSDRLGETAQKTNAQLIAAAPNLKDLLREITGHLSEYRKTGYMTGWDKSLALSLDLLKDLGCEKPLTK